LAYSTDLAGDERYELRFLDLSTRSFIGDPIAGIAPGGGWCGNDGFCYLRVDDAWRPDRVFLHRLAGPGPDQLLISEPDERFWLAVDESRDRRYVIIAAASKNTSSAWLADSEADDPQAVEFHPRQPGVEYELEILGGTAYVLHNDGAPDFALSRADLGRPDAPWELLIPGQRGRRLLGVSAYHQGLVISYRRDGLARVAVGTDLREIEFGEPLFNLEAAGNEDPDTDRIRLSLQSMVTPEQVYDYVFGTGELVKLKERPVLDHPLRGSYHPTDYVQRREWATAADGTRIPISLVGRAGLPQDGSAGCLLYGYGAYEISIPPSFSIARLSLLDRGYWYAIAHVRGGGELGRSWYEGGRMGNKPNTFSDFVSCAEHLVAQGYTSPSRLAIEGGSAGGLLIGAVLNRAPEAFAAAHAAVPFVDPLNTILDPSLPLTVTEWEEWGDPLHDAEAYGWIKSYSPYENLRDAHYPALLVTASLADTRVEVTEPAKWVAALRHRLLAHPELASPLCFKTELHAGHGGVSGRYAAWRDDAFELAWLLHFTRP
jgi:oligopeptidase B